MNVDPHSGPLFVTGATGLIGSHVAERFATQGYRVVCGARAGSNLDFLKSLPVDICEADITDPDSLIRATRGMSAVIHTAGRASDWGRWNDFYLTNVQGTLNVLGACVENGISRVIVTGSVSCFGEEDCRVPKDEESPHHPRYPYFLERVWPSGMNRYRISKSNAVTEAEAFARRHALDLTVIHPVWVYGEREFSSGFYEYMQFVKSGIPFGPGSKRNYFHSIYAPDLALAYQLALEKAPNGVQSYIVGNNPVDNQHELFTLICREMGKRKPINLPKALVYPIGLAAELAASVFGAKAAPFLTRARVNMCYDSIGYRTQKAENELGFRCRYSLEEGIRNTVKWYIDHGLI